MRLTALILLVALVAAPAALVAAADDCGSKDVPSDEKYDCCVSQDVANREDQWCQLNYPQLFSDPPPLLGTSCGTVSPDSRKQCCETKVAENTQDDYCEGKFPDLYNPIDGASCSSVSPDSSEQCCETKVAGNQDDDWCQVNYPELYAPPPGSSCSSVSPNSQYTCCKDKVADDTEDEWCQEEFPDLYTPTPVAGGSCGTVSPDNRKQCCETKILENTEDDWCEGKYPSLYNGGGSGSGDNLKDYPYMAVVHTPHAKCTGSLIAPGYILTAAQCVWTDNKATSADDVSVWVGGKWHEVDTVLVNTDKAKFADFAGQGENQRAWDIAMIALIEPSSAAYVGLPTSDVPAQGSWVTQVAWKEDEHSVETGKVNVWDGCVAGWTDELCVGGAGFLQECPADKGAPLMQSVVQVGLSSGPGCAGESDNWGYYTKLADKQVLEQITVWLNYREGTDNTGLDDNVRAWMQEANTYIYGRR